MASPVSSGMTHENPSGDWIWRVMSPVTPAKTIFVTPDVIRGPASSFGVGKKRDPGASAG